MPDTLIDSPAPSTGTRSKLQGSHVWYELMTTDPAGAKRFYDAVVGWSIADETIPGSVEYRMIVRSDGSFAGGLLTLSDDMQQGGARPAWLGYIGVDDVDEAVRSIEQGGGATQMPPSDIPDAGRIAMVADPQGAPFYVMKPAPPPGQEDKDIDVFSVDRPEHVRWNELSTSDADAAVEFYTRQFGWVQEGEMDMGEYGKYRFIHKDGVAIGAIMPRMPDTPASMWTYYIGVDDIDRAAAAIADRGGKILNGPMEIPGGEFALNGVDPQGASFGLVGPRNTQGE